jgi:putative ABC transport system ATP-binding protein
MIERHSRTLASRSGHKSSHAVLSVRQLTKGFAGAAPGAPRRPVLAAIDLDVAAGEYVAIMGESGIGKSTLLNLIAGLDAPDSGTISLAGTDIAALDERKRTLVRRHDIGFVFQAFHLLPRLTVAQNIALPLSLLGYPRDEATERAVHMLERLGLVDRVHDYPRALSSGQLQRVAIGRALVHHPRLVLADEPTGNLDPDNAAIVLELLAAEIAVTGAAGILVTHSEAAASTTQRVLELTRDGLRTITAGTRRGAATEYEAARAAARPARADADTTESP